MNIQSLIDALEEGKKLSQFIGFEYRAKKTKELARHTIILGAKYENILRNSLLELELMDLRETAMALASEKGGTVDEWEAYCKTAREELRDSITKSLEGKQDAYTKQGQYREIMDGIRVNLNDMTCEIYGLSHRKMVLEKGTEEKKNINSFSFAKNRIRSLLSLGKFRTFSLDSDTIKSVRLQGQVLELK